MSDDKSTNQALTQVPVLLPTTFWDYAKDQPERGSPFIRRLISEYAESHGVDLNKYKPKPKTD